MRWPQRQESPAFASKSGQRRCWARLDQKFGLKLQIKLSKWWGKTQPCRRAHEDSCLSTRTLGNGDRKDIEKAFDELDAKTFNEAFLVRNCVVHNGGRNSAVLARVNGSSAGAEIRFEGGFVTRLITPIKKIAAHLSPERL